jgi:hypothetical protein
MDGDRRLLALRPNQNDMKIAFAQTRRPAFVWGEVQSAWRLLDEPATTSLILARDRRVGDGSNPTFGFAPEAQP